MNNIVKGIGELCAKAIAIVLLPLLIVLILTDKKLQYEITKEDNE